MSEYSYNSLESMVIVTDFYLFQKYNYELLKDYCRYFGISECLDKAVKEKYPLSLEISNSIQELLLRFLNLNK